MIFCTQVDENTGTAVDPSTQFPIETEEGEDLSI
jgi:hypothetical protein